MDSKWNISPGFCFLWAVCLLLLPLRWAMGAMFAALVHESAHYLSVTLLGGNVCGITLGGNGAVMETLPMSSGKEALCALGGPMGSFSLLLAAEHFPEAAVCGVVQGLYNLIPVFPLDGGRIMRCLFSERICRIIEIVVIALFFGISLWITIFYCKFALLFFVMTLFPMIRGKFTCKDAGTAVQ